MNASRAFITPEVFDLWNNHNLPTMKKIILSVLLTFIFALGAYANPIIVVNNLSVPITLSFAGINITTPTTFVSTPVTLNPGYHPFANPTLVPGMSASAQVSGRFRSVFGFCSPYDMTVGNPVLGGPAMLQYIPAGNACNNGMPFTLYWEENPAPPYLVTVHIMP